MSRSASSAAAMGMNSGGASPALPLHLANLTSQYYGSMPSLASSLPWLTWITSWSALLKQPARLLPPALAWLASLASALAFDPALLRAHPATYVLTHPPFVVLLLVLALALHAARQHRRQRDRLAVLERRLEHVLAAAAEGGGGGGGGRGGLLLMMGGTKGDGGGGGAPTAKDGVVDDGRRGEELDLVGEGGEVEGRFDGHESDEREDPEKRHILGEAVAGMATRLTGLEKRVEDVMDAVDNVREGLLEVMKVLRGVVMEGDGDGGMANRDEGES